MSVWTLCLFAFSMVTAVASHHAAPPLDSIAYYLYVVSLVWCCGNVLFHGIRKPVA